MSIFRKCHIKLFLIVQVGDPFRLWLHFYSVFEFPPKSVFHYFGLSWARLEKCIFQSAENFKEHRFHFFDILRILEPDFQNIHIPGPRKSVLGPGDVFGRSWGVQKSLIYLPLTSKGKRIGVITVQSFKENTYSDYHVNILRNLAVYTSIALDNAEAYEQIAKQKKEITDSIQYAKRIQSAT